MSTGILNAAMNAGKSPATAYWTAGNKRSVRAKKGWFMASEL
jgi:hypothetical protein